LSYDKLGSSAKTLLHILSFLHHKGITEEIFKRASLSPTRLDNSDLQIKVTKLLSDIGKQDLNWNSLLFQELIMDLESFSLIEFNNQNQSYNIHPLVQHWSAWMLGQNQTDIQKCVLGIIGLSISLKVDSEDYRYQYNLLEHISSSITAFKPEEIDVVVLINIANVYYQQGQWKKAEALHMVVIEKRKQALGEEHPDTLTSMGNLASIYWNQGQWKEAEALDVVVIQKRIKILGVEHPNTLTSIENLASIYWNQSQWKEAEALRVMVMEKRKQALGEAHPDTLKSMGNLASIYWNQGQWKEAAALDMIVMQKRIQILGEEHPDTLTSMGNLASTYRNQGQFEKAEALEMMGMMKRKHLPPGEEHPDMSAVTANPASTYEKQRKWKDVDVGNIKKAISHLEDTAKLTPEGSAEKSHQLDILPLGQSHMSYQSSSISNFVFQKVSTFIWRPNLLMKLTLSLWYILALGKYVIPFS